MIFEKRRVLIARLPLTIRSLERTRRSIAQFAMFHRRSPAELRQPDVRRWVKHLMGQGSSTQRLRQHFAALRFLCGKTLGRPAETAFLS